MTRERRRPARPGRLRRWFRNAGIVCMTFTAVGAAALVPATAAHAANGVGWYWMWRYDNSTTFYFSGGLPQISLVASGSDNNGVRQVSGTITDDNPYDGRCALINISTRQGLLAQRLACNGTSMSFSTGSFSDDLIVALYRVFFQNGWMQVDQSYRAEIPDTYHDAELRTADTGLNWYYFGSDIASFNLRRPGVSFSGELHHVADATRRSVTATVWALRGDCVKGWVTAADWTSISGQTCWRSLTDPWLGNSPAMSHDGLLGSLSYSACVQDGLPTPDFGYLSRCLYGTIPMPNTT
jgi:hypothetical protein